MRPIPASSVDVERIQPPHVTLGWVRARGTLTLQCLTRREKDAPVTVHEVTAGGLAAAAGYLLHVRAIDAHDVLLIARSPIARALKDQLPSIVAEIRFGVFAAVGQLADVSQMRLSGFRRNFDGPIDSLCRAELGNSQQ